MLSQFLILLAVNLVVILFSLLVCFWLNIKKGLVIAVSVFIIYLSLIIAGSNDALEYSIS